MADHPVTAGAAIALTLNGVHRRIDAAVFATLADVLRAPDGAGLTGTKIGCDAGDCGACTVLMNGASVCACLVPAAQASGADILTIEGNGGDAIGRRLAGSFLAHGAAQCGICTPGMIMAARGLLARTPSPSRRAIADAIGGVLCRCTGYLKIIEAITAAAGEVAASAPADAVQTAAAVGQRVAKSDAPAALAGQLLFGADAAPADSLWLRVVRSPHASATFTLGDLDAFRRARGLMAVLTADDVPGENLFGIFPNTRDQPVLAAGRVRFRGEAVLLIAGTGPRLTAFDDTDVPITWTVLPMLSGIAAALAPGATAIHARHPDNVLTRGNLSCGNVAAGHAAGTATVEGHFETSFVEHAYIEPEAGYATPLDGTPGRILIAASTQAPTMDREAVARVLGLPETDVIIRPTACGGGFGGKLDVAVQPLLAVAAHVLQRPVRMIYTRTESMASTTKRHPAQIWARASADATGRLTAFEMAADFNTGAYASWGPTVANRVPIHAQGPYRVANVWNRTRAIYTNDTPAGAFRGFGVPQAAIAGETLIDDLAERLGIDRWQIRRINALRVGDVTPSGQRLAASAGLPQCLDALKPAWEAALAAAARHNAANGRRKRGAGVACMWYGCGNTSLSNPSEMRLTLGRDGRITLWSGAVDIGQGVSTILPQIAREALAIAGARVDVCDAVGRTDVTPDAGKTSASRQTFVSGRAVEIAARDLRQKILRLANAGHHAPIRLDDNVVIAGARGERRLVLADLPHTDGIVLEGHGRYDPPTTPLDADGQGIPYATYGFAAQVAEVEVDLAFATTKVLHIHAAHDVGRAINPTLVEGQIHGGIAQGLGLALMEEFIPGRTENLHDYLIPTAGDIPEVTLDIVEDAEPEGPFGAKGVGEPALIATAPAILSAIRHATGVTVRKVPVLPHRLWAALQGRAGT